MAELNDFSERQRSMPRVLRMLSGVLLMVSIVVFAVLGVSIQYQDLKTTYTLAEETTDFLKAECQKYENYTQGNAARSLQDLLDHATSLKQFISEEDLLDAAFLKSFIRTEHVGGVMVLDAEYNLLAEVDMDGGEPYPVWKETLQKESIRNMFDYPLKSYVDNITLQGVPYDFAAVPSEDGGKLIVCYASTEKPAEDPYEMTMSSILANNNFYKNPVVIITDGTQVLSSNKSAVSTIEKERYQYLRDGVEWRDDALVQFQYDGETWYGLRRVYEGYFLYAIYASKEVFSDRTNFIIIVFMAYLLLCVLYLVVQRSLDKKNLNRMEKQLRTINAISISYASTFLLHLDRMELEPINPSPRLRKVFEEHGSPYDFLFHACQHCVTPEHRRIVMDFLDLNSMAARLKNCPYLGNEVKDADGVWYSIMLIPQRWDAEGNVQAVLATTQNVAAMKQAEELSFNDKLTGLHNRNYMEARSENIMRAGELPVSFIMADCNYLKQTNDTLGHECGELLLKRVADSIRESLPEDCVAMRIGGDEFLVLCAKCPAEKAAQIVADIQQTLDQKSENALPLSVSFGVYTAETEGISFREAYDLADQAMYEEKQRTHKGRR